MQAYFPAEQTQQYIKNLDAFLNSYNNSYHISIGLKPTELKKWYPDQILLLVSRRATLLEKLVIICYTSVLPYFALKLFSLPQLKLPLSSCFSVVEYPIHQNNFVVYKVVLWLLQFKFFCCNLYLSATF